MTEIFPTLPSGWYVNFYMKDIMPPIVVDMVGPYPSKDEADVFKSQSTASKEIYDLRVEERQ